MKKYLLLFFTFFLVTTPVVNTVWAIDEDRECTDEDGNCEEVECEIEGNDDLSGCTSYEALSSSGCGSTHTCHDCKTGYTKESFIWGKKTGYMCVQIICDASTCASDTTWRGGNTGYQYKTNRSCNSSNACIERTVYQCAVGYYGSSSNGTSGCTRCPTANSFTGTSPAGTTTATGCYIASGTTGRDTTGNFTYAGNSYYCQ